MIFSYLVHVLGVLNRAPLSCDVCAQFVCTGARHAGQYKVLIDVLVGTSTGAIGGLFYRYTGEDHCLSAIFLGTLYWSVRSYTGSGCFAVRLRGLPRYLCNNASSKPQHHCAMPHHALHAPYKGHRAEQCISFSLQEGSCVQPVVCSITCPYFATCFATHHHTRHLYTTRVQVLLRHSLCHRPP